MKKLIYSLLTLVCFISINNTGDDTDHIITIQSYQDLFREVWLWIKELEDWGKFLL